VIGFDDAPFARSHRGDVMIVGVVYAGIRPDGVLSSKVRRDGANATRVIAETVRRSRFYPQLHAVLLQGIAFAGFNVVDLGALHCALGLPVIVVTRRRPDLAAIRRALLGHVRGGARKWRLIENAGPMETLAGLYVQRAGIDRAAAESLLRRLAVHSAMPEPLRLAHMIAGGVTAGESANRV
ncbi:MAG: DUF99 family protein, partial [Burkholderiales bacterium]